jgi:hypothetical protein
LGPIILDDLFGLFERFAGGRFVTPRARNQSGIPTFGHGVTVERSGHAAQTIVIKFLERAGRKHPIRFFQITFH